MLSNGPSFRFNHLGIVTLGQKLGLGLWSRQHNHVHCIYTITKVTHQVENRSEGTLNDEEKDITKTSLLTQLIEHTQMSPKHKLNQLPLDAEKQPLPQAPQFLDSQPQQKFRTVYTESPILPLKINVQLQGTMKLSQCKRKQKKARKTSVNCAEECSVY